MFGAAAPHALTPNPSARLARLAVKRTLTAAALLGAALLLMACPRKQGPAVNYSDAESSLRLAINVNEVAYHSWNKVYEGFGALHRDGKISEARWASISAIDGVIVLSEADLIEGIERSKKLLDAWRKSSEKVLSAESVDEVSLLREGEADARQNFNLAMEYLNTKSLKLRHSYAEAIIVADAVVRDGHQLPTDHLSSIRQIIKMVDQEMAREQKAKAGKHAKPEPDSPVTTSVK